VWLEHLLSGECSIRQEGLLFIQIFKFIDG
jgi:hypothetical protein